MSSAGVVVIVGERRFTVTRESATTIQVDGTNLALEPAGPHAWQIRAGDESLLAHAIVDGDTVWVHAGGRTFVAEIAADAAPRRRQATADEQALSAPMPAAVRAVLVQPGQHVEAGDLLIMLEAMKMELPVRAPRAGVVRAINCRPGELVQPGPGLVELS
jgi:3-methylcrotonyl-CoA carboxylase alpha subunit